MPRYSVLRPHCLEEKIKSKGHGKLSIHFAATQETIETIFRIIVSANQLSLYGAVAEMCEEYESLHDRSGRPDTVMGQSIVLSAIKTVSLDCDDPTNQDLLLQQYGERIERLSQQDKLSKFSMDAGFLNVVEIGQYFMTKDTRDLTQFHAVACREYTVPREEDASQPRGWVQGNTKIGPVLEVTTSCLHGKYRVEIRIWSPSRDNTHSWVGISHGSNKFVMDSNNNDTEVPEDQFQEHALQLDAKDFSCRSAGTHVYNPHLLDNRSTSSSVRKVGALVLPSSCLDGGPHGWVPVNTHSTPVPSSTGEAVGGLYVTSRAQYTTRTRATRTWWRSKSSGPRPRNQPASRTAVEQATTRKRVIGG